MDINEFVNHGIGPNKEVNVNPEEKSNVEPSQGTEVDNFWDKVIQPKASYLVTGDVGTGKSGLAYYILERYSAKYNLTPAVVGLPKEKQKLLPGNFKFLEDISQIPNAENSVVFIDEADIQLPLDSNKNKEAVINFLSLPRQRKQIFILAYHFPRLVKGTYLPFFSAFLFKRPPYLLEFASKKSSDELTQMMTKASERFDEMTSEDAIRKHCYLVAPRIRWQGVLENPLPSFWTEELSEIWSGVKLAPQQKEKPKGGLPPGFWVDLSKATGVKGPSVNELMAQAVITEGRCRICGAEGKLYSETCERCFRDWANQVAGSQESPGQIRQRMIAEGKTDPYYNNIAELQQMCREKELPATGNKDDLILRLFGN